MITKHKIILLARELRKNPTPEESLLWGLLRKKQLNGLKFLRQHPIIYGQQANGSLLFFVADFYCAKRKLIVELDGRIHDFQKEYDHNRDAILAGLGLRVVRIENDELIDSEKVLRKILGPNPSLLR